MEFWGPLSRREKSWKTEKVMESRGKSSNFSCSSAATEEQLKQELQAGA